MTAVNVVIADNRARNQGGAVFTNSTPSGLFWVKFSNCLIAGNAATLGGGIYLAGGQFTSGAAQLRNCTVSCNRATRGREIYANTSSAMHGHLQMFNSIAWCSRGPDGNVAVLGSGLDIRYSNIQGSYPGLGNIDVDPLFSAVASGDFRPIAGSPVNDAASNSLADFDELDLDEDGIINEPLPLDLDLGRRYGDDPLAPNTGVGTPPQDMGAYER